MTCATDVILVGKKLYANSIGVAIDLDTHEDLTLSPTLEIYYRKPSGVTGVWTGVQEDTTKIRYITTSADDLDEIGVWDFKAFAFGLPGDTVSYMVYDFWD